MSSLYRRILLWFVAMLAVSLAFVFYFLPMAPLRFASDTSLMNRMSNALLRQAREMHRTGGPEGLRTFLENLEQEMPARFYLLDPDGRDLATGQPRPDLLKPGPRRVVTVDGFHLVSALRPEANATGVPFVLILIAALAALCWLFTSQLVSPVRSLALTMDRFGRGDMSARSGINRRDEIGELAHSFNRMADRIESLLTAERRLLQDVSHEMQSPLARLAVAAKLTRTAEDREAAAHRIQREIERMSEMVAALLEVTRAEGDPAARRSERVDLKALVDDITDACEWEASEKQCHIDRRTAGAFVQGDEELLRRAIENVLRNAVRYSPQSKGIGVDLSSEAGIATLTVRDQGPGVPDDALRKLFSPFFRVEGARDRASGGTGLGLSVAQRAIHIHQGTIQAENANPGLRMTITLHTS